MARKREPITSPIGRNIFAVLQSGDGYKKNIEKLESAGISREQVNNWIGGRRNPQMASLQRISKILCFDLNKWFKNQKVRVSERFSEEGNNDTNN